MPKNFAPCVEFIGPYERAMDTVDVSGARLLISETLEGLSVEGAEGMSWYGFDGSEVHLREDGFYEIVRHTIRRIEMADMNTVARYNISTTLATTSHNVEFTAGGTFSALFDDKGVISHILLRNVACIQDGDVFRVLGTPLLSGGARA